MSWTPEDGVDGVGEALFLEFFLALEVVEAAFFRVGDADAVAVDPFLFLLGESWGGGKGDKEPCW